MKERLEDGVAEAKRQQILHRLFAEIVVDPVNLVWPKKTQEIAVECHRTGEIVAERLLNDDARPGAFLFAANESRARQAFHDGAEELRVGCKIEQAIAGQAFLSFQLVQPLPQFLHALGSCEIGTLVEHMGKEVRSVFGRRLLAKFCEVLLNVIPKRLIGFVAPPGPDNDEFRWQILVLQKASQSWEQFSAGKITGRSEQNQRERLRRFHSWNERGVVRTTADFGPDYGC